MKCNLSQGHTYSERERERVRESSDRWKSSIQRGRCLWDLFLIMRRPRCNSVMSVANSDLNAPFPNAQEMAVTIVWTYSCWRGSIWILPCVSSVTIDMQEERIGVWLARRAWQKTGYGSIWNWQATLGMQQGHPAILVYIQYILSQFTHELTSWRWCYMSRPETGLWTFTWSWSNSLFWRGLNSD